MRNRRNRKGKFSPWVLSVIYLVVICVAIHMAYMIIQVTIDENMKNRAFDELKTKLSVQGTVMQELIHREYLQLYLIENVLTSINVVEKGEFADVWDMLQEKEQVTLLAAADLSGNVIDFHGEYRGNIGGRNYFIELLEGQAKEKCVYLQSPIHSKNAELLYAIPIRAENQMKGVLFKSKKISNIEEDLMEDFQFRGNASMFLLNPQGDILLVGDTEHQSLRGHNLFEGSRQFQFQDSIEKQLKQNFLTKQNGICTFEQDGVVKYAAYAPSEIEDWMIFTMVDRDVVVKQYQSSDKIIRQSLTFILVLFLSLLIVSIHFLSWYFQKQKERKAERFYQYRRYREVMNQMTVPIFRYHVEYDFVIGNKKFKEMLGADHYSGVMKNVEVWEEYHPEYNFRGLFQEIKAVAEERKVMSFESMLQMKDGKNRWIKTVLVPVRYDEEMLVFGTFLDTTEEHEYFEEAMSIMGDGHIGLYRFCFREPFHVDYMNEAFRKMLGYTRNEADAMMQGQGNYVEFLEEGERERFRTFLSAMLENGGGGGDTTCEYRMRCKDGTSIMVSDTIEVKEGSDGTRYGYGVVFDISKYREAQERNEKKLEKLQIQLNESRIKISTGQMQPHFLYNALASIREVVLEDPEYAADLIFDFTTHLRACIKSMASEEMISFVQEIENIKAYVSIEKMRFGEKMQVQYDIQESDFQIVPLSVQPLVENAIRHGIYERGSIGGVVKISSKRQENHVVIQVEDNGVGFDVDAILAEVESQSRDSTGLQSLIFRFENLMNATVEIESVIGTGTRVTICIPMKGEEDNASDRRR